MRKTPTVRQQKLIEEVGDWLMTLIFVIGWVLAIIFG